MIDGTSLCGYESVELIGHRETLMANVITITGDR